MGFVIFVVSGPFCKCWGLPGQAKASQAQPAQLSQPSSASPAQPAQLSQPTSASPAQPAQLSQPSSASSAQPAQLSQPSSASPAQPAQLSQPSQPSPASPFQPAVFLGWPNWPGHLQKRPPNNENHKTHKNVSFMGRNLHK